jgi:hypothetical protein
MYISKSLALASLAIGLTSAAATPRAVKRSAPAEQSASGKFLVDRQVEFDHHSYWSFDGGDLPEGLRRSTYTVGDGSRVFTPDNAIVGGGYLDLLVNGGQTAMPYRSGEIVTAENNIRYASVRTVGILSEPAGVCNGTSTIPSQ